MILTNTMLFQKKLINVDYQIVEQNVVINDTIISIERYEIHSITCMNNIEIINNFTLEEIFKLEKILKECLSNLREEANTNL